MRVAVLSDIHGNLPALEAVLVDVGRENVDAVVVPGDSISGPWPVEVLELLEHIHARVVRGNADRGVLDRDERHGPLARWCAERLGAERLSRAAGWPLTLELDVDGLGRVLVCHSTPSSDEVIYTRITPEEEVAALLEGVSADVVVSGHTHMQFDRLLAGGLRVVNPGSVGMPYEGRPGAYWALLGPDVELRRTEYDVGAAAEAALVTGAPVEADTLRLLLEPPDRDEVTAEFEQLRAS